MSDSTFRPRISVDASRKVKYPFKICRVVFVSVFDNGNGVRAYYCPYSAKDMKRQAVLLARTKS